MAVHDYVIDNSTGANVRSDINNALAAIVSNNSSSSEPSTTKYAYMWWADTTNGILKIRNSANDGWVELLQLDGTLTLEDGSASSPALAFRDDLDTGIFSGAANTFNISTGAVERLKLSGTECTFNETGADVDFRVESDGRTHMLFVDAGNNRVGLGCSAPDSEVVAQGSSHTSLQVWSGSASTKAFMQTVQDSDVRIGASTNHPVSFFTNGLERLRIDSSGNVMIGATSASGKLHVEHSGEVLAYIIGNTSAAGSRLVLQNKNTTANSHTGILGADAGGQTTAQVLFYSADNNNNEGFMTFETRPSGGVPTERMRINSSGSLLIGTTSQISIEVVGVVFDNNNNVGHAIKCSATGSATFMDFRNSSGTQLGNVKTTTGSNLQFNTSSSDRSLKKNFENWTENTLELFKNINPQKFNFIFEEDTEAKTKGYIAQDLVDSFPEAYNKNDDDKYMFNPSGMVVYLMKAIQELEAKVAALEAA